MKKLHLTDIGALVSIVSYLLLASSKVIGSFITNSEALRADGFNNVTDIFASVAVLIGIRIARKPRDLDHPYGHSRHEQISSLIASFIMMSVGLQVIFSSLMNIFQEHKSAPSMDAMWIALISAVFMYCIYRFNYFIAKKEKSLALEAAAKDNLSDAWVSIGTVIGILGASLGYPIIDTITAIVVGILICKTSWEIFIEATHLLTDGFNPSMIEEFKSTVEMVDGVHHLVDLKARSYGNETIVDVTVKVLANIDIKKAHNIADEIELALEKQHQISNTHVHMEPL